MGKTLHPNIPKDELRRLRWSRFISHIVSSFRTINALRPSPNNSGPRLRRKIALRRYGYLQGVNSYEGAVHGEKMRKYIGNLAQQFVYASEVAFM